LFPRRRKAGMDDRTLAYVKGRFGDYYRGSVTPPDFGDEGNAVEPRASDEREWAFISFGGGMVRHKSLLDLGSLDTWLADTKPQHVYYSSARYDRPEAQAMSDKGWRGADLIFDLDADHLRDASPDDTYAEMLAKCKDALFRLLEFVEGDLGFEDTLVVFSGGRGYHVHVYDDRAQNLGSDERREIVDYVKGTGFRAETHSPAKPSRVATGVRRLRNSDASRKVRGANAYGNTSSSSPRRPRRSKTTRRSNASRASRTSERRRRVLSSKSSATDATS